VSNSLGVGRTMMARILYSLRGQQHCVIDPPGYQSATKLSNSAALAQLATAFRPGFSRLRSESLSGPIGLLISRLAVDSTAAHHSIAMRNGAASGCPFALATLKSGGGFGGPSCAAT
jgi:hypothetical protein